MTIILDYKNDKMAFNFQTIGLGTQMYFNDILNILFY